MGVSPDDHKPTGKSPQFHTFQENLLDLFQLCTDLVQIFQGSLTLVGHPVFNKVVDNFTYCTSMDIAGSLGEIKGKIKCKDSNNYPASIMSSASLIW